MSTDLSPVIDESSLRLICRPYWSIWASLHWGYRKHACVLWACAGRISPDLAYKALGIDGIFPVDVVVFYRELVTQLTPEKQIAQMVVDAMSQGERKHMKRFFAGKQVFEAGENRRAIDQLINEVFVPNYLPRLRESDDSKDTRVADARNFSEGLRRTILMRSDDPPLHQSKTPLILISEECPQLIETIPALESDRDKNPEDTKMVDNEQDSIWEAAKTCYREYPNIIGALPGYVKRQMAIEKGITPTQRFLNAIEYDHRNRSGRITRRR